MGEIIEDLFQHFDLSDLDVERGWCVCRIKTETDPRLALRAASVTCKYVLSFIQDIDNDECTVSAEWFVKAKYVLSTVVYDDRIGGALAEAHVDEAISAGKAALIIEDGIKATSWHEWVLVAVKRVVNRNKMLKIGIDWPPPRIVSSDSIDEVLPRMKIESTRALKLLAVSSPDADWPTITQVADGLHKNSGVISRLLKQGKLRDNGLENRDRRVDPVSILKYCKDENITYNET